jgi:hypothetical protein
VVSIVAIAARIHQNTPDCHGWSAYLRSAVSRGRLTLMIARSLPSERQLGTRPSSIRIDASETAKP